MSEDTDQDLARAGIDTGDDVSLLSKLAGMEDIVKERNKQKQHFFYVVLQDSTGKIVDIGHYNDYEVALMRGMEKAKESGTSYSIFSLAGKFVDGNFVGK